MSLTTAHDDPELYGEEGEIPPPPPPPSAKFKPVKVAASSPLDLLTAAEAEALVLAIKQHAAQYRETGAHLRRLVTVLHQGEGWKALGYPSWRQCVLAEFDSVSQSELYRALEAGLVEGELLAEGFDPETVLPESHLLALKKLPEGEKLPTYEEALQAVEAGQTLTTEQVQQLVANKLGIEAGEGAEVFQAPEAPAGEPAEPKPNKKEARQKACQMLRELILAIVHERKTASREELAQSAVELLALVEDL